MKKNRRPAYYGNPMVRTPGKNRCYYCDRPVVIAYGSDRWRVISFRPDHGRTYIIGYAHDYACFGEPPSDGAGVP